MTRRLTHQMNHFIDIKVRGNNVIANYTVSSMSFANGDYIIKCNIIRVD